jgi:hypothetical protein
VSRHPADDKDTFEFFHGMPPSRVNDFYFPISACPADSLPEGGPAGDHCMMRIVRVSRAQPEGNKSGTFSGRQMSVSEQDGIREPV